MIEIQSIEKPSAGCNTCSANTGPIFELRTGLDERSTNVTRLCPQCLVKLRILTEDAIATGTSEGVF